MVRLGVMHDMGTKLEPGNDLMYTYISTDCLTLYILVVGRRLPSEECIMAIPLVTYDSLHATMRSSV